MLFIVVIVAVVVAVVDNAPHMSSVSFSGSEGWRHGFLHDDVLGFVLGGGNGNGVCGDRLVYHAEEVAVLFLVLLHSQIAAVEPHKSEGLFGRGVNCCGGFSSR